MAASVPADKPWAAPKAGTWDRQTIASWFDQNLHTQEAQNLTAVAIRGVYGEEPTEISLLDVLRRSPASAGTSTR